MTKEEALNELLALIHGDGGHYTKDHGTLKSIQDAEKKVIELKTPRSPSTFIHNETSSVEVTWFGEGCEYQINEFGHEEDSSEPLTTFCNHDDNSSACEGNCYKENCPLRKEE